MRRENTTLLAEVGCWGGPTPRVTSPLMFNAATGRPHKLSRWTPAPALGPVKVQANVILRRRSQP